MKQIFVKNYQNKKLCNYELLSYITQKIDLSIFESLMFYIDTKKLPHCFFQDILILSFF